MSISFFSILMAIDIRGRSLLVSCTQSRPTFKNRTASSLEKSPLSAGSSSCRRLLALYICHTCIHKCAQCLILNYPFYLLTIINIFYRMNEDHKIRSWGTHGWYQEPQIKSLELEIIWHLKVRSIYTLAPWPCYIQYLLDFSTLSTRNCSPRSISKATTDRPLTISKSNTPKL